MRYIEISVIAIRNFPSVVKDGEPEYVDYPIDIGRITLKTELIASVRRGKGGKTLVELASGCTWIVEEDYDDLSGYLKDL